MRDEKDKISEFAYKLKYATASGFYQIYNLPGVVVFLIKISAVGCRHTHDSHHLPQVEATDGKVINRQ